MGFFISPPVWRYICDLMEVITGDTGLPIAGNHGFYVKTIDKSLIFIYDYT